MREQSAWLCLRATIVVCAVMVFALPSAYPDSSVDSSRILSKASREKKGDFLVVHLKGSPYEMGYQQGVLLKSEIHSLWKDYFLDTLLTKATKSRFKQFLLLTYFKWKGGQDQKYISRDLKDEMRGIAHGSGLSYSTILTMHTFLDTMTLLRKKVKTCTNFILMPELTVEGTLYHARDLGFAPSAYLDQSRVIFFFEPDKGVPFASIAWPGMCGVLSGMNANGISISETGVGTAELNHHGAPIMFLLREVVQYADNLDFAVRKITSAKRICGYTVAVAEDNKKAITLELTGRRYNILFPEKDHLICVNHYLTPGFLETMKAVYPGRKLEASSSYKRLGKFNDVIAGKSKFTLGDVQELLLAPPLGSDHILQSIVFMPHEKKFTIYSAPEKQWLEFSLNDYFPGYTPALLEPIDLIGNQPITPHLEGKTEARNYTKLTYTYLPQTANRLPDRTIWIYLFLPKAGGKHPLVMFFPHSAGISDAIELNMARFFSSKGFAFLTMEIGYQKDHKKYKAFKKSKTKLEKALLHLDAMKEFVVESQNILDWAKTYEAIDSEHICIGGISLGSIEAELVLELRDDAKTGLFLLGAGDLERMFKESIISRNIRAELSGNSPEAKELLRYLKLLDPLNLAYKLKSKRIFMINALFDAIVPRECTLEMWRAAGYPSIRWLLAGHIASMLSLGYVEHEALGFLEKSLKPPPKPVKVSKLKFSAPSDEEAALRYEQKRFNMVFTGTYSAHNNRKLKLGLETYNIFDTPLFFGMDLNGRWESDERYHLSGGLMPDVYVGSWITSLTKLKLGFSSYQYRIYKVAADAPQEFKDVPRRSRTNFLTLDLLRSTIDDKFFPTHGTVFEIKDDISSRSLGSDFDFSRLETTYKYYYNLGGRKVLALRAKCGYASGYGDSGDLPFFEKFYLGGSGTVRGYRSRRVGPLDDNLLPLGGRVYELANVELRFPVYHKLHNLYGAVFFDEGLLADKASDFTAGAMKYGTGFGIRYKTPWGVGRVDLGFKVGPDRDKSRYRLHATFGVPF